MIEILKWLATFIYITIFLQSIGYLALRKSNKPTLANLVLFSLWFGISYILMELSNSSVLDWFFIVVASINLLRQVVGIGVLLEMWSGAKYGLVKDLKMILSVFEKLFIEKVESFSFNNFFESFKKK